MQTSTLNSPILALAEDLPVSASALAKLPAPLGSHNPLITQYLPPGQLTLLISHPSTGKSLLALHIAAALSRNQNPFTGSGAGAPTGINHAPTQNASNPNGTPANAPAPLSNALTPKLSNSPDPLSNSPTPTLPNSPNSPPSSFDHSTFNRHSSFDIHPSPEILILSEDDPISTIIPRLKKLHADLDKIHLLPHFHSLVTLGRKSKATPDPFRPLQLLQHILNERPNIRFLILDPLLKYLNHRASRADFTQAMDPSTLLEKIIAIAHARQITILATATLPNLNLAQIKTSLAKNFHTNTIKNILLLTDDPRGTNPGWKSGALASPTQNSSTAIGTPPNAPAPDSRLSDSPPSSLDHSNLIRHSSFDIRHSLLLLHLKSQNAPAPTLSLTMQHGLFTFHSPPDRKSPDLPSSPLSNSQTPNLPNSNPLADWLSQTANLSPRHLPALTRQHRPPAPAVAHAMNFLRQYLTENGPTHCNAIFKILRANSISETTLHRASRELQIVHTPNLFTRQWLWHLKEDPRPFPGDPNTDPVAEQARKHAKEQVFFQAQTQRRLHWNAFVRDTQAAAQKAPPLDHLQQNKPSQPTPTQKPAPQSTPKPATTPQPPRPPSP